MDGDSRRSRARSFLVGAAVGASATIAAARRLRPKERRRETPAGLAAFEARGDDRTAIYSYEQRRTATLDADQEARFRAEAGAWEWFQERPLSYRRAAIHWVTSAKRPETRERRLRTLIEDSAAGRPIGPLSR